MSLMKFDILIMHHSKTEIARNTFLHTKLFSSIFRAKTFGERSPWDWSSGLLY